MKRISLALLLALCLATAAQAITTQGLTLASLASRTTTSTGSAIQIKSNVHRFLARSIITNNSGTTPTADCKIQHAPTDVSAAYKDLAVFTQVTTGGPAYEDIHITDTDTIVFPFVRAVCTLAGTNPNYDISIVLYEDGEV